jgi:superfamily II DNA or RNA helicase
MSREKYYQLYRGEVDLGDDRLEELRPGQRGAVFAMRSWATAPDEDVAILGLPTGYGKSELIALAPFLFGCRRALVIAPSVVVRRQLKERMEAQEHLRSVGIIPQGVPLPQVNEHVGRIKSPSDWTKFVPYDVVVSHTQSVSPIAGLVVDPPDPGLFDLLIFDEAHHLGAPSWVGVRSAFPDAAAVGFTATPYRRDRRSLFGRTIFQYPIDKAVDEGFFVPIMYRRVQADASTDSRDEAVAAEAIAELHRRDAEAGEVAARLLVRADTVKRAYQLAALYHELDSGVSLEVITHETTKQQLDGSIKRLRSGMRAGVAFVGVLGEGFDLPSLKIAAYHNPHRSLPVTIQFAGRVARTERNASSAPGHTEHAVLIATSDDHPNILAELHRDGQRWDRLIPSLAKELGEGPARAWTVFSSETADMAAAFTLENFRTFLLADVYRLSSAPDADELAVRLARLYVMNSASYDGALPGGIRPPRDSARGVKVIQNGLCFAALLARERQMLWLQTTPSGIPEYEYIVLAIEPHLEEAGSWWLCVRSTLPPDMTAKAIVHLLGKSLDRPSRSEIARYHGNQWPAALFIGLGKRAIHPVVAGVLSYETGAGRSVDQAVTLDDRALHEFGHAIGVVTTEPGSHDRTQIGIAMEKRRVWQTGYERLGAYAAWAASLCRDLEHGAPVSQLGGLRIADSPLDPKAKPIAADFGPFFDANWDAEYHLEGLDPVLFSDLSLAPMPRSAGADVELSLVQDKAVLGTITYAANGQLLDAVGEFWRRGRRESLSDRLQRHAISVFFNDGSVMRGPGGCISPLGDDQYFVISDEPRMFSSRSFPVGPENRFAVLDDATVVLPEKDGHNMQAILASLRAATKTAPASLFQFVVANALTDGADFVFCDDGANEVADFVIGWKSYPRTLRPHLRLVHCKAMSAAERKRLASGESRVRNSGVKDAEEICQQTLRSIAFLLRPVETMRAQIERRAEKFPQRYVIGTIETFDAIMSLDPLRRTTEIWAVHPGLSRGRLLEAKGRPVRSLLSALRARGVDARADVAVLGRG